ncbi:MAG: hypothetical protein ACE5R6_19020 [Candidatus Heimdallarchaeota archaeon]
MMAVKLPEESFFTGLGIVRISMLSHLMIMSCNDKNPVHVTVIEEYPLSDVTTMWEWAQFISTVVVRLLYVTFAI